jgi:CBS-domain-containing membrane protein
LVSEGGLIGRREAEREARQDWWLTTLAEGEAVNPEFLASRNYPTARYLMSVPVISIAEETSLGEIAELLSAHRIKRVPVVVRDGRIVGIVRCADLVRALAARPHIPVVQGRMRWRRASRSTRRMTPARKSRMKNRAGYGARSLVSGICREGR